MASEKMETRKLLYVGGPFDGESADVPMIADVHSREMGNGLWAVYRVKNDDLGTVLFFEMIRHGGRK